jgi:glycosyltransferase AglD
MKNKYVTLIIRVIGGILVVLFILLTYRYFDGNRLLHHFSSMMKQPDKLLMMVVVYGTSFWLRALAWKWYVQKNVPLAVYMSGLFLSLFVNHITPVKIGDAVRISVLAEQKNVSVAESLHSVAVLRLFDMLLLLFLSAWGIYYYFETFSFLKSFFVLLCLCGIGIVIAAAVWKWKPSFVRKHLNIAKQAWTGPYSYKIIGAVFLSWLCEAIVVFEVAKMVGFPLSIIQAVWVNSMTVAGQVFQIAPGGLATYEAAMSFALTSIQPIWDEAYVVAILTHAFKFAFSYAVGFIVLWKYPQHVLSIRSLLKKKEVRGR